MSRFGRAIRSKQWEGPRSRFDSDSGFIRCGSPQFLFKRASVVVCRHTDFPFIRARHWGEIKSQDWWLAGLLLTKTESDYPCGSRRDQEEGVRAPGAAGLSRERPSRDWVKSKEVELGSESWTTSFAASVVLPHQPLYRRYWLNIAMRTFIPGLCHSSPVRTIRFRVDWRKVTVLCLKKMPHFPAARLLSEMPCDSGDHVWYMFISCLINVHRKKVRGFSVDHDIFSF